MFRCWMETFRGNKTGKAEKCLGDNLGCLVQKPRYDILVEQAMFYSLQKHVMY